MEERMTISLLLDFYGSLLTERQRECYILHHEEDMSFGEIADELGVSRQSVHDTMQRAKHLMESYEEKLHLIQQYMHRQSLIDELRKQMQSNPLDVDRIEELLSKLEG